MNNLWEGCGQWVMQTSWQAGVLVLVVLVVQYCSRHVLAARWRYALWFLVLLKLVLPWGPDSPLSVFNLAGAVNHREIAGAAMAREAGTAMVVPETPPNYSGQRGSINTAKPWSIDATRSLLTLLWLLGSVLLALRLVGQTVRFHRLVGKAPLLRDPGFLALLEACRNALSIRRSIRVVETELVSSPALFGYFRPTLLLPRDLVTSLSSNELRHVFLHELGHVKRHDMLVLWTVSVLRIVHWVNPVLWFGFRRMAADRELACDELVLSHSLDHERRAYGATILRILQRCAQPFPGPSVVGILEDKSQVVQRISMIANFQKRRHGSVVGALLTVSLGLVTLTEAMPQAQEQPSAPPAKTANTAPNASAPRGRPSFTPSAELEALKKRDSEMTAKEQQLEAQLEQLKLTYTDSHPKVIELRSELQQLAEEQAALENKVKTETAREAAMEAFRRRYGLLPRSGALPTTGPANPSDTAGEGSLGRYGMSYGYEAVPKAATNAGGATNSASDARAAFLRRYGLTDRAAAPPGQPSAFSPGGQFRTSLSSQNLPLRLDIDADGALRFGGEGATVSLDQVRLRFAEEVKRNPSVRLSIRADKNAPFGQIIHVMDAAKDEHIQGVDARVKEAEN